MKTRMLALLLLVALLLPVLVACDGTITQEKAEKIALKDLGVTASEASCHTHVATLDGAPCYSIYVTVGSQTYEYIIDATGEILQARESEGHSH